MSITLTLGGIVFQDFEIPEAIRTGGTQMHNVHKLPGGGRVIDAMGPDDKPISWSGRFRGARATERARQLDFMRRQGAQLLLSWGAYRYQVLIVEYEADFQQSYEIPYRITCEVVQDEVLGLVGAAFGFLESVAGDIVNAVGLGDVISVPAIDTALVSVSSALSNYRAGVPSSTNLIAGITSAGEGSLVNALQTSLVGAQGILTTTFNSASSTFVGSAIPAVGASPTAAAAAISAQASNMATMSGVQELAALVNRTARNVGSKIANG